VNPQRITFRFIFLYFWGIFFVKIIFYLQFLNFLNLNLVEKFDWCWYSDFFLFIPLDWSKIVPPILILVHILSFSFHSKKQAFLISQNILICLVALAFILKIIFHFSAYFSPFLAPWYSDKQYHIFYYHFPRIS